MSRHMV